MSSSSRTSNFEVRTSKSLVIGAVCLALGAAVPAQTPDTVRVTAALANVRSEPGTRGAIVTTVKAGTKLELRGVEGNWYKVAVFVGAVRVEGYVSRSVAALDQGGTAGAAAPTAAASPAPGRGAAPAAAPSLAKIGMSAASDTGPNAAILAPVLARVTRIADRADSARAAALAMPVGQGKPLPTNANAQITYVWVLDRIEGARAVTLAQPSFVVRYRDAPGVSPEDFSPAIVRLIGTAAGPRVMSALRGRVDQASRAQADWDAGRDLKQDLIKSTLEHAERGVVRITPAVPLEAGAYAIVMRPTGNKKFAGASLLSEAEEGRVFGIAWLFVVK